MLSPGDYIFFTPKLHNVNTDIISMDISYVAMKPSETEQRSP